MAKLVKLDGSMGEGGGQILRSGLTLSLLSGRALRIENIRAGRDKPGLRPQHLRCVTAAAEISAAEVGGAQVGSRSLEFRPGPVRSGSYRFAIGTAGATGLVLHALYLPLAKAGAESRLTIEGGTHVPRSPCFHFLATTWRDWLHRLDIDVELDMRRAGFFPKGGGILEARIHDCQAVRPLIALERGPLERISGISAVANLPESIAERQQRRAQSRLADAGYDAEIEIQSWPSIGKGTMLGLSAHYPHGRLFVFGLGALGKRAERVADEAVDPLLAYLDAAPAVVDPHSADQIVLPLAFAAGRSEFTTTQITSHLETNIEVLRRFVDRTIRCEGARGAPGRIILE
jgi:RNA 3'-terminal phosphate cyclase (ATP)